MGCQPKLHTIASCSSFLPGFHLAATQQLDGLCSPVEQAREVRAEHHRQTEGVPVEALEHPGEELGGPVFEDALDLEEAVEVLADGELVEEGPEAPQGP